MNDEPTPERLREKQERGEEVTMADVPKGICEVLLDVLVQFGLHVDVPRGIKPPLLVVALYRAADAYYSPLLHELAQAQTFLASIASAQSQGTQEQTDWMIAQAREGLRRCGGHDFDAEASRDLPEPGGTMNDLPPDLLAILRDQSIIIPKDGKVFELIARWAKAPSNTASADPLTIECPWCPPGMARIDCPGHPSP